jgi:hypothetical protein
MSTARESRLFDGGLTFAAESASSAVSHKQMARSRATLGDIRVETAFGSSLAASGASLCPEE